LITAETGVCNGLHQTFTRLPVAVGHKGEASAIGSRLWNVPTLAAYPGMMQRARKREGLRVCRAAWLIGVSVREYREIEAGDRTPSLDTYRRICKLYGWPQMSLKGHTTLA
jgi:DNA-binding XRE family transcriptional regulator